LFYSKPLHTLTDDVSSHAVVHSALQGTIIGIAYEFHLRRVTLQDTAFHMMNWGRKGAYDAGF